ncbi:carboxypeptidase-like regulatory domain-containing protein [Hymenobacter properus]|uniref:Carboxypeptidase regulatory-like domain-containing protein n=1 Tax=Hymenobacter properus TaxID=2791026 RepID=A0A931BEG4_9BACT|nr:carboxypeptidase-like regulatory domain-containing protein [Hymenobacter properus]MBF9141919.1 carboxypeptidase regulatory-like domain-containing protein [Hymenobacter properus]MBR7720727.1 carboxypeptidase regulatory-like domain-containing protein [Microvirga sp. SRT04]
MFNFPSFRTLTVLLAGSSLSLAACTHTGDPAPSPSGGNTGGSGSQAAYTVAGVVLDTKGQPVAGALVRAENDVTHSQAEVHTDATGHYTMPKLEFGGWKIYAWKETTYKGQAYTLRMGMPNAADYDAFSTTAQGTVRNFRWQLSGRIPDRPISSMSPGAGYFGGAFRFGTLDSNFNSLPAGTEVTVTLTPVAGATLFDGSAPQVIQKSFTVVNASPAQYNYWLTDIPQCEYRITAQSNFNGITKALTLSADLAAPYQTALPGNYFKSSGSGSYESGLGEPQIPVIYLR